MEPRAPLQRSLSWKETSSAEDPAGSSLLWAPSLPALGLSSGFPTAAKDGDARGDQAAGRLPFRIGGHGGVDGDHGVVRGQQGDSRVPGRHARSVPLPMPACPGASSKRSPENGAGAGASRSGAVAV